MTDRFPEIVALAGDLPALLKPLVQGTADYAKGNRFRDFHSLSKMPLLRRAGGARAPGVVQLVAAGLDEVGGHRSAFNQSLMQTLRRSV